MDSVFCILILMGGNTIKVGEWIAGKKNTRGTVVKCKEVFIRYVKKEPSSSLKIMNVTMTKLEDNSHYREPGP